MQLGQCPQQALWALPNANKGDVTVSMTVPTHKELSGQQGSTSMASKSEQEEVMESEMGRQS